MKAENLISRNLTEGELEDNGDVEDQVINQLSKSSKLDEIDTVTFGLETDDGKIVKVYVKAEQADDFEKALAEKLGEVDDIEEALNELSKEYEIVDVEWPDAKSDDDVSDDDGNPETDGSESLNQAVYKRSSSKEAVDLKPKMEGLELGSRVALKIFEAESGSIESRMANPVQMLIYHSLIELGVPEVALEKSPYKSSIIIGIRRKAIDIGKNPQIKVALKMFVQRAAAYHQTVDHMNAPISESLEQFIQESLSEDFWGGVIKLLKYLSGDDPHADKLIATSKFKTLVSRSVMEIPKVVNSNLRMKLSNLTDLIDKESGEIAGVTESTTPEEVSSVLSSIFTMVDPTPNKTVSKTLLTSPEYSSFLVSIKPVLSQKFSGPLQQRFRDVVRAVQDASVQAKPTSPGQSTVPSTPATEQVTVPVSKKLLVEAVEWTFEDVDGNTKVSCGTLKFTLDREELERLVKAINSHDTIVVKDAEDQKNKYTFSPRGINLVVKKVGENTSYQMGSSDVSKLTSMIGDSSEEE